jgi:hypothetical protein
MTNSFLFYSVLIALGATALALIFGLFSLFKGGEFNAKYGTKAMQWRILLQGVAIVLFTLMLIMGRS